MILPSRSAEDDAPSRTALPLAYLATGLAMVAFAGNSLLCRAALRHTAIDPATFTSLRLVSGAASTWLLVRARGGAVGGSWISALFLFAYAAGFSFAYRSLPAALGAFLLFASVQATMVLAGLRRGERLAGRQWGGLVLALAGLAGLLVPGLTAPPLAASGLMLAAGAAWGCYSLRSRGAGDALGATAGNFLRAAPLALGLSLLGRPWARVDPAGAGLAALSGALASGLGYALWYAAMGRLRATAAATVQLSVPVLTALAGVVLLGEPVTPRLVGASLAILVGLALVLRGPAAGSRGLEGLDRGV